MKNQDEMIRFMVPRWAWKLIRGHLGYHAARGEVWAMDILESMKVWRKVRHDQHET